MRRKKRSDAGVAQITGRDLYLLPWIADQYAIREDQLKQLMEQYGTLHQGFQSKVTVHTVKYLYRRWVKAGWVERKKKLEGEPAWIWLTSFGLKEMDLPYDYLDPSAGRLNHYYWVNAVRLYIERQRPGEVTWRSERQVNPLRKADERRHRVDGEVAHQQGTAAIEVELTAKSKKRWDSIFAELKQDYDSVWYFVAEDVHGPFTRALKKVPRHEETFTVYRLRQALT